jgi:uncharacterized RDD family membrane protein YckC
VAVVAFRLGKAAGQVALLPLRLLGDGTLTRAEQGLAAGGRAAEEGVRRQVEAAVDRALAGPMPDSIARSLAEHRVAERIAREILASPDFQDAVREALASPQLERIAVDAAEGHITAEVAERVLQSPEVRAVLTQQTMGFADELIARLRARLGALDDRLSRRGRDGYGGIATRGAALITDLALAHLLVLLAGLGVWLLFSLVGGLRPEWLADTLAGLAWFVVVTAYFVSFWTLMGQTLGMRLMDLSVVRHDEPPGVLRSIVRFVALVVSVAIVVGLLPVLFDGRRRGLQDYVAGTVVLRKS